MADAQAPAKGHPKGLYLLFTVEMWERMSYYGMRALLTLYMTAKTTDANPGFGMSVSDALVIYSWYTGLVYLTPVIGGYLADRYLGQRRAVMIGAVLMTVGHFLMALPGMALFYAALAFLIVGNGFFKPNISTMVGGLYEPGDPRRDSAFTIFYIGINVGAVLASVVCGTLGETVGFHYGFGSAGIGMALGLVIFSIGAKRVLPDHVGAKPEPKKKTDDKKDDEPVVAMTKEERDRIAVILVLAVFVVFFWAAFEQAGGLMNIYTKEKVDRVVFGFEIPATWFQAVNPGIIVIFGSLFSWFWGFLARRNMDPPAPVKMAFGLILLSFGFVFMLHAVNQADAGNTGLASLMWIVGAYFWHTMGELCLSPIGLSMVTKLSPPRIVSLMMGIWFFANFIANLAAGYIGAYSETLGEFDLFAAIVLGTAGAGIVLFILSRKLVSMMHMPSEGSAWSWGKVGIAAALCLAFFYGYPKILNDARADESFVCTWEQREAKASLYQIREKQLAFYDAAKEGQDDKPEDQREANKTFTSDLDALGFYPLPDRIHHTQREAMAALEAIAKAERTFHKESAEKKEDRKYSDSYEALKIEAAKTTHYEVKLELTEKGYLATATRKDEGLDWDGRNLKDDVWTIDERGLVMNPAGVKYEYVIEKADEHGFVAKATRKAGGKLEGDTFTIDNDRNLQNPQNACGQ